MVKTFKLDFRNDNYGIKEINEPVGFSDISFGLKRKSTGHALDEDYLGDGKEELIFYRGRNHQIDQILYYHQKYGFESVIYLIINDKIKYQLEFETAVTDDYEYFKCICTLISDFQLIKKRIDTKVDLISDKDIEGNLISPLVPTNTLIKSKPIFQKSTWEQAANFDKKFEARSSGSITRYVFLNPCINQINYEIEDSYNFFETDTSFVVGVSYNINNFEDNPFKVLTAKNNLNNVKINIKNLNINLETDVDNGGNGYVDFKLEIRKGIDYKTAKVTTPISINLKEHKQYAYSNDISIELQNLQRNESVWIYFLMKIRQSATATLPILRKSFEVFTKISGMTTEITAESNTYNTVSPSFRLVDVIEQVSKSISGKVCDTSRLRAVDEYYNTRIINGNFLRGITDKPFNVSLNDLTKSMWGEAKIDFEIQDDGSIFWGFENDYYTNNECYVNTETKFAEMQKTTNQETAINEFWLKFKNYQSKKENEEKGSSDTVHGETRLTFFNKGVENKKEIEIEWTRDVFLIDQSRRKAIEISKDTTSQEDDTLFALDTAENLYDLEFQETTLLYHTYISGNNKLSLKNKGDINFLLLGIEAGDTFTIMAPDKNAGTYTIFSIANNELILLKSTSGSISSSGDGERSTKYSYKISKTKVPFRTYTIEGITNISGLNAPTDYGNLRFSLRRILINYWQPYLATCNMWWKDKPLITSWYKNNPECTFKYNGVTTKEGEDFVPINQIYTTNNYENVVLANISLNKFIEIRDKIKSKKGYIRTIEHNNRVIKLYPDDIKYRELKKEVVITGKEKYEPAIIEITTGDFIKINNEYTLLNLQSEVKGERIYLYDNNRQLLYNPIFWNKIAINGSIAETKLETLNRLELLK